MRKVLIMFAAACFVVSSAFAAPLLIFEDDCSALNWSYSSEAAGSGVYVVSNSFIQMNSWHDGGNGQAKWTNMWRGTGVPIQANTAYFVTYNINSFANGKAVELKVSHIDDTNSWTNFILESWEPLAGEYSDKVLSFSTEDGQNAGAVGNQVGLGCGPGWWNNLGVDYVTVEYVAAEPNLPANDTDLSDNLNEVGTPGVSGVDIDLQWYTMREPNMIQYPNFIEINPDVTTHFLYYVEKEVGSNEPNWLNATMVTIDGPVSEVENYTLTDLNYGSAYYWRVDECINDLPASDPNTVQGVIWAFETINAGPVLFENPQDTLVAANEDATFSVVITSTTTPTYDWYMTDDQILDPFTDTHLGTKVDDPNITIPNVPLSDAGKYVYCVITNSSPQNLTSGAALLEVERLAGHWKMDNNLLDSSAYGYHGTMASSALYDMGVDGNALQLFEDPNHVEIVGSEDAFNFYHLGLTASCWVKSNGDAWGGLICKQDRDGYSPWAGYVLLVNGSGQANFNIRGSGGITGTSLVNDNQWHFVTATYDGETGEAALYVDGELEASDTLTAAPLQTENPVTIGVEQVSGTTTFDGFIDDARIYNHALADTEVLDLYNALAAEPKNLCLLGYGAIADIANSETGLTADDEGFEPDCKVNLDDFAAMAANWLTCGLHPTCP